MSASKIATPAKSFADADEPPEPVSPHAASGALSRRAQGWLLVLNTVPLLHTAGVLTTALLPTWTVFMKPTDYSPMR